MRLTTELLTSSLSYLNPLKERELDLRDTAHELVYIYSAPFLTQGHKIPQIENLGAVATDHESIDFTDNDIAVLGNFPLCPRMRTLLCARNRITTITSGLGKSLPGLKTLVLTGNGVRELGDLEPLAGLEGLVSLSLVDNPVASKENYRYYTLHLCPSIRFLDFQKVKDAERAKARELFGSLAEPTDLAKSISSARFKGSGATGLGGVVNGTKKMKITESERKKFEMLVRKAKTLQEVQKLEKAFAEGRLPSSVGEGEEMDET